MKKLFILLFFTITLSLSAQSKPQYKIVGNEIVRIKQNPRSKATKTTLVYKIKGKVYPVYKSARGKYFIIRVSKRTGKEYKQYLKV